MKKNMSRAVPVDETAAQPNEPKARRLRARSPIATAPSHVSQLNVEAVFGIDPRRFLDLLRGADALRVVEVGRLRLVEVEELREYLRGRPATVASTRVDADGSSDANADPLPETPDEVLAALGRRRSA